MLGPGNEQAAAEALAAWPGGMQVGGGIDVDNAARWLDRGASHVIVTSWVFRDGIIDRSRLDRLVRAIGQKRLVLDLSCRRRGETYFIVTDRWQKFTEVAVNEETLDDLSAFCDEFLIHAADVEGKCAGVERDLVARLGGVDTIPITYAGGVRNVADLEVIKRVGRNRLDATIGSSLDIFGGTSITYEQAVMFHNSNQ
jgi:phosphoribosylformimino-5-aminoimidazole carboxamide ribotide isomerase